MSLEVAIPNSIFHRVNPTNSGSIESGIANLHQEILERCVLQDQHAQMQIYNLYYKAMYNTAFRIVQDPFEAEDILQESFLSAFQKLKTLEDFSFFSGWLKRIVVNRAINEVRRRKHQLELMDDLDSPSDDDQEEAFAASVDQVKAAMRELPKGYNLILNLYLLEGYDHEEIGEILGVSSATSRSQFNRGKKKLLTILNKTQ